MELEFTVSELLKTDEDGYLCFSGKQYFKQIRPHCQEKGMHMLSNIINTLGERSAKSQKLKQIITTVAKFSGSDQRIYIKTLDNKALGFVKVGQKKLFYHDFIGNIKELYPTAVLDIYVHQSCQRSGIGKEIFEKFLKTEGKTPQKLAYDRPSQKLISFLKKHYNLSNFIPQNNNYVIFDRFFMKTPQKIEQKEKPTSKGVNKTFTHQSEKTEQKIFQKPISASRKTKPISSTMAISVPTQISQTTPMIEKIENLNYKAKVEEEDSLTKLAKQMEAASFQPRIQSHKEVKQINLNLKEQPKALNLHCPWAIDQKINFRTTSNTYGNYYRNR